MVAHVAHCTRTPGQGESRAKSSAFAMLASLCIVVQDHSHIGGGVKKLS